jgi:hypothetical protein
MTDKIFPDSEIPVRKTSELLPQVFQSAANDKFLGATLDPLTQPGVLQKTVGYVGRRYGKNFNGKDVYLDNNETLRSRYQLEPGVVIRDGEKISNFYDYLDFKNQIQYFGNTEENDSLITSHQHYSWNPPIDWDKFINFREYYWVPEGPPSITIKGQAQGITSSYRVKLGTIDSYIFFPDGLTNNPTITLYRGQTYKFIVNAPAEGFTIKTNYDVASIRYDAEQLYTVGSLVLFGDQLYRAKTEVPSGTLISNTFYWQAVDSDSVSDSLNYNTGVTNNGVESGTLTFEVPLDAPDVLYYQSKTVPNRLGRFIIGNIESNTKLDVENEILGKLQYTSSNGITLSSGMAIRLEGNITPAKYNTDEVWIVEGVGTGIDLVKFTDLVISSGLNEDVPEVLFDNTGFDTEPFDDAVFYPGKKDYIVINRVSRDLNPWSRYNRWFHKSVLEQAFKLAGADFDSAEEFRAKRPIIEFKPHLKLFNHGAVAKISVDFVDDFTTDVFSKIEGSRGYIVDGEELFEGARLLVISDTDRLANNKIYQVKFIAHNGIRQITLQPTADSDSIIEEGVLVKRGVNNQRLMYHFDGTNWVKSQLKTSVNQAPLFDVYDDSEVKYSDLETYPSSTFFGNKIISYRPGNGRVDSELGFPLSYLNIGNVGDIQFDFNWESESFSYQINQIAYTKSIFSGFYKFTDTGVYDNAWIKTVDTYIQPIIDSAIVDENTNTLRFNTVNWVVFDLEKNTRIDVYLNGEKYTGTYTRNRGQFTFDKELLARDVVYIKLFCKTTPDRGYYELPVGLEKNPLNDQLLTVTYGTAADHLISSLEFSSDLQGTVLGTNNVRDINNYQQYGTRILKHSGTPALAVSLLCDKDFNIIKSLQYAKKQYTEFKNSFIDLATTLYSNQDSSELVDNILDEIGKSKTAANPFADSDMAGSGAFTKIEYTVEDTGINTFALSEKFDLDTLSRRAVYVYLNSNQLIANKDYTFDSTFGFVRITAELVENSVIEIREYVSTASNYIPPTPTKLGLYKKYLPQKFLDDTYTVPKEVIQGHDGSITVAYGDFRDDVLLELEFRIYNNLKKQYNPALFDIDQVLSGYYNTGVFSKSKVDIIFNREYLKWLSDTNTDYISNRFFDQSNSFTYTYSAMTNQEGTVNLPGYWRGVYQWYYDTDRPHRCPWEMLGFSEKPTWWEEEYGPAPYTNNNLILWEDLRDGIVRRGDRAGTYDRYKRPTLMSHLPVDGDGKLLSPLNSGLANNFTLVNNSGDFKLGDVSPVEYAWRSSSEFPFAIIIALSLLKPFEYITDMFDNSSTTVNKLGQTINNVTSYFSKIENIVVPVTGSVQTTGLVVYIFNFLKSKGVDRSVLVNKLRNINVAITTRLSGFVDQENQKYILDSKNPKSSSGNVFVPAENYDIIFNVSSPIATVTYSGVIFEKAEKGWIIKGYDQVDPFFNYYRAVPSQSDQLINIGGVAESFVNWAPEQFYGNGIIIRVNNNEYYRTLRSFTSKAVFDTEFLQRLADLPVVGSVNVLRRRTFNTLRVRQLVYGTVLGTAQEVVDFLLGYEAYLIGQGFKFDGYTPATQSPLNWTTAAKEFMFWTKHNWQVGALLTVSPSATGLELSIPVGVVDNLFDNFYDYSVFKSDGTPLGESFIQVRRDYQQFLLSPFNTNQGIYFFKAFYVLKEHVTVFDDRTVFNDVIYDKTTGYRQERIKSRGFRTTDWDGDYTSPGFIFDNVDIKVWQPYTDYKLGDIISYRGFNWTSKKNQPGTVEFDDTHWSKLDSTPEKRLVANFDYRINQFEDYYDSDADGVIGSQRELSRHLIGYQSRKYLQDLAEDEVIQFKLYQGFIREKGTVNAVVKVFDKTSKTQDDSIVLKEEWAFRVGRLGGVDQRKEIEFNVPKDALEVNPQPIIITMSKQDQLVDQYLRIDQSMFSISETPYSVDINPLKYYSELNRSAGFVKLDQVALSIGSRADLTTVNINALNENDHIWITFDTGNSWNVLRFNRSTVLRILSANKIDNTIELILNRVHTYKVGDYVGIKNIPELTGFFRITSTTVNTIVIAADLEEAPDVDISTVNPIFEFTECKFENYADLDARQTGKLKSQSRLWIERNSNDKWEVVEKTSQYSVNQLTEYGITTPRDTGYRVAYADKLKQVITSMPGSNFVIAYKDTTSGLVLQNIIAPPSNVSAAMNHSFGKGLTLSTDERWLIVGAPEASGIRSQYIGDFEVNTTYFIGDIVSYGGNLWEAVEDIPNISISTADDGSTINFNSKDWKPATLIEASSSRRGTGYFKQGCILIYEWADRQWNFKTTIVSPGADIEELFGHDIAISKNGNEYVMAVSAPGAFENRGRVYLYKYNGVNWSHLENSNYAGVYTSSAEYPAGAIVWYDSKLWQAKVNIAGDGSTIGVEGNDSEWIQIDPVSTESSLPANIFIDDDGSTIATGILTGSDLAELTKSGDQFGFSVKMNLNGSVLAVTAPYSDSQFFANFKGDWKALQEYTEDDVVRFESSYYKLVNPIMDVDDSSEAYTSTGQIPELGDPWVTVGDSTDTPTGKVFIYQRDQYNRYALKQTITASNINDINDTSVDEFISSGDLLGYALDIDYTGNVLIVSSPESDVNFTNQGVVYVFETNTLSNLEYRLKQRLESYDKNPNEFFGSSIAISPATEQIVVGAKNSPFRLFTRFDTGENTLFDSNTTSFSTNQGYPGAVYVFQRVANQYILSEQLVSDLISFESFGFSVDCTASTILVGSPDYKPESDVIGTVKLFKKSISANSWNIISTETELVNINLISSVSLFDYDRKIKLAEVEYVDHYKNKILGDAEQEINYKTLYDPAIYSVGTDDQVVDQTQPWREKHVGEVWWDLSTVKWINYEQGDLAYRVGNWNRLAAGASIDVYEWVETRLLPSEWADLADTAEGLTTGVSGQPLYPDDTVYAIKEIFNIGTGQLSDSLYYYWVKNKTVLPNIATRRLPIRDVASLIANPGSSSTPVIAFIDADKFLAYNFDSIIGNNQCFINIEYKQNETELNPIHNEYQLLTEGQTDSVPAANIERKWIDSLVGFDQQGNPVPDSRLAVKQRYGLSFRPRQTMFVNREKILKIVIDNINSILQTRPFADTISTGLLSLTDPEPSELLKEYDVAVESFIDLEEIGTARVRQAVLQPIIVNGQLESIQILDSGFGYRVTPIIEIEGDGIRATAEVTIDSQGRVVAATVLTRGKRYTTAIVKIRQFSVLVKSDSTASGYWSIYSWDQQRSVFYRSKSQGFNTENYWNYVDWWAVGYSATNRIVIEISDFYLEPTLRLEEGDLIRVKEFGTGGWAVLLRTPEGAGNIGGNYNLVGRQKGTIALSDTLYNTVTSPLGFDNVGSYDTALYDLQPSKELRNILQAIKQDVFVEDLAVEWNKLFFVSINYAFSEQEYIDWAFKTSFLNALHNAGPLEQRLNYKNDNLDSYRSYLEEVKPYRTTIREYTSRYVSTDNANSAISDFDLPPTYSVSEGKIVPISARSSELLSYPWKWWTDNNSYGIVSIEVADAGADYTSVPRVLIEGNGTGATAQAFISNRRVSKILLLNQGTGYTKTPTVTLVGGNGFSTRIAKAVPILGDSKVRTFNMTVKFDRISKEGIYQTLTQDQTFVATGATAVFDLNYAPTNDKSKIQVYKNNQLILSSEYNISLFRSTTDSYTLLKGKLTFVTPPINGDVIEVSYEKNSELLDSVNRINKFYAPTSGMIGNEIGQLMTGIDFGGVQVQGTTFDVTGGWDALPWFTEGWDSVESNSDFYYVLNIEDTNDSSAVYQPGAIVQTQGNLYRAIRPTVETSTGTIVLPLETDWEQYWELFTVELPFTPAAGELITIYVKRNEISPYLGLTQDSTLQRRIDNLQYTTEVTLGSRITRIDDPYYTVYDGSTIQPNGRSEAPAYAVMPSLVGDGNTNSISFVNPETGVLYLQLNTGDTLVFRTVESDGSVTINDVNLVDTNISGGTLSSMAGAYLTATGTRAEEISIDGDKFITPDQVPAPEENVPGQVLDSVSIKVFNTTNTGAAPLQNKVYVGNGVSRVYNIDLEILESKSVIVYVDKIKQNLTGSTVDYTLNLVSNTVEFVTAPAVNSIIEIISIGIGGIEILDYQEFIADGETNLFLTNARFNQTSKVLVTVNGEQVDTGFINSTSVVDNTDSTLIQFGIKPPANQVVKIICLGVSPDTDPANLEIIRVNKQVFEFDGSTRSYNLDNFVNLSRGSAKSSILVSVNNVQLLGIDTIYEIFDGSNNNIVIGVDPLEPIGNITSGNIRVFVNGELKRFVIDYVYDGNQNLITIPATSLTIGDEIKIEVDLRTGFTLVGNLLTILNDVVLIDGDEIEVTWFSEYPTLDVITDEFTGGKVFYRLSRIPLNVSYLWIYKNGERLSQGNDYRLSLPQGIVYLTENSSNTDQIKIVQFGTAIRQAPIAYEVYKDMLNVYHFKRFSKQVSVTLARDLYYYDQTIEVTNASNLFTPVPSRNLPGVVIVNSERIEYFVKTGNTLGQLRRGSLGTAIAEIHVADSYVVDSSASETVPYNEEQQRNDFVSDGSSLLIGPLDFVPIKSTADFYRIADGIPDNYGQCDELEVFVGGRRLRKKSLSVYSEALGASSPSADVILEAEFSVDGTSPIIRLTTPVPAGQRITVIKRIGKTWYNRGVDTATTGNTFLSNDTPMIKFIKEKSTELPE